VSAANLEATDSSRDTAAAGCWQCRIGYLIADAGGCLWRAAEQPPHGQLAALPAVPAAAVAAAAAKRP